MDFKSENEYLLANGGGIRWSRKFEWKGLKKENWKTGDTRLR